MRVRPLRVVAILACVTIGGCSLSGAGSTDAARFYGTWRLTSFEAAGTGLSFRVNETVVFRLDRTFDDNTAYYSTTPISGQWSLPEAGKLRLHVMTDDIIFLGGTEWEYEFAASGDVLTLRLGDLEKVFRRAQGVVGVSARGVVREVGEPPREFTLLP